MRALRSKANLHQTGTSLRRGAALESGSKRIYLLPGNLYVSVEPCQITTILGSCVSICLWDKQRRAGGMNHFLLPASPEGAPISTRFADAATGSLLEQLRVAGCNPENMFAKIFGGAAILQSNYPASLGAKNVAVALHLVANVGIPVVAQETGGNKGRRIVFNTENGDTWSRKI